MESTLLLRAAALILVAAASALSMAQAPIGTVFTYQGSLYDSGAPFDGNATMIFELWDAPAGGAQLGVDDVEAVVVVTDGLFTVLLNDAGQFGAAAFDGNARWLQITVNGSALSPRQPLTPAPYAHFAVRAGTATSAGDAGTIDGLNSTAFLRSNTSDQFTSGTLTINAGTTLDVAGTLRAASLIDRDNAAYFVDPSNAGTSLDIAGSIQMVPGEVISCSGQLTVGGANLVLRLGDSTADQVVVPAKEFFMADTVNLTDGDQNLWFLDGGVATANFMRWDETMGVNCGSIGSVTSGFRWHITDNSATGWALTNGTDASPDFEFIVDDIGDVEIDAQLTQNGACDLAERFFGPEALVPGTVLVLDPTAPEYVRPAVRAYEPGIVGVVSTFPGILMGGPRADAYPLIAELKRVREMLAGDRDNADLQQIRSDLEAQFDAWPRGNVETALVGRVPVRVTGAVRPGQHLTASNTPGVAMAMSVSGPTLGLALGSHDGNAEGTVLALLQPGWYGGVDADASGVAELRDENHALRTRLDLLEAAMRNAGLLVE